MMKTRHHPAAAESYAALFDPATALLTAAATLAQNRAARTEAKTRAAQLNQSAAQEARAGAEAAAGIRRDAARRRASERARLARAGVVLDGSPILRLGDLADVAERNAQAAERGGAQRATALNRRAAAGSAVAGNRQRASLLRAGTTLLRGFARFGR